MALLTTGFLSGMLGGGDGGGMLPSSSATSSASAGDFTTGGTSRSYNVVNVKGDGNAVSPQQDNAVRNGPEPVGGPIYGPALNATAGFPFEKAMFYGVVLIVGLAAMKTMRGK